MSKPLVEFGDVEHLVVDWLTTLVAGAVPRPTVSVGVPDDHVATDTAPHLEVAWDGTPTARWPIVQHCTIRIVARAKSTTIAKLNASLAQQLLLAGNWPTGIASIRDLTGILAARDPNTLAELAAFTVQVNLRSTLA